MSTWKGLCCKYAAVVAVMVLSMGWGPASAAQDQFTVDVGKAGEIVKGEGTGFNHGAWYYYPRSDRLVQWFLNDAATRDSKTVIAVDLTISTLDPKLATGGSVEVSVNWTKQTWSGNQSSPPLPDSKNPGQELKDTEERVIVPRMDVRQSAPVNVSFEIPEFCPQWISIDVRGQTVRVEGRIRHDCVPKESTILPKQQQDFGDAPDRAYRTLLAGNGARHTIVPGVYLGRGVDGEADGQPNATATGDDLDGDDEDGVVFASDLVPGETTDIQTTASVQGALNAWVDWNADGDWDDDGEHVFVDESLSAGSNTLTLNVPAAAKPGETFARFRFSTQRGVRYDGPAPDGEVEDYLVQIAEAATEAKPPVEHLKWSQPPIETDPTSKRPIYCGWGEPAYATRSVPYAAASWTFVADDFRCAGDMPVASVHWWGAYQAWTGDEAPRIKPESWRIGFWSNAPADQRSGYSRPNRLLWVVNVPGSRVEQTKAGTEGFPQKPSDTTFEYLLKLQPQEYFRQDQLADSEAQDHIFWISITAVYTGSPDPQNPWGWQSRPRPWAGGAVRAEFKRDELRAGFSLDPATARPIASPLACERQDAYDMAFELDTAPDYILWEQPFTGLRQWAHYEDEESLAIEGPSATAKWTQPPDTAAGIDVDMTRDSPLTWPATICADDFECRTAGPITGITLWTSWYRDALPGDGADNVTFTLSIRQDIPANRSTTGSSMPGKVLWRKQFSRGQFTIEPMEGCAQGYYSPANGVFEQNNHLMTYKYTFKIDPSEAFQQAGTEKSPVVYWLAAQARVVHTPGSIATRLGWRISASHWNDAAAWVKAEESYDGAAWSPSNYPKGHTLGGKPIDLAFAIETQKSDAGTMLRRMVADDWTCRGDVPITGVVWWGSYRGDGYLPGECQQMVAPRQPDSFLLSIWTDVSGPGEKDTKSVSRPGKKIWEYKAEKFDEVLTGFDNQPELTSSIVRGFEPVYRYTVRLPQNKWFRRDGQNNVYWLSVVAVYKDAKSIVYPWGWTNHPSVSWDRQTLTPLAWWKLDETAGKLAADSAGGNHGAVFGNPVWRPSGGWIGGALDLDGRGDYVKVEKPKGFDFAPKSFSVSTWVYPRETRGQWRAILEYDRDGVNRSRFGLWLDTEGRFHFRVGQNTWHSQQSLAPSQWYHLAAAYDAGAKTMSLYVNGALDGAATGPKGFALPYLAALTIGACGSVDSEFFNGLIDDVRVFTVAVTAEEVLTLAGAGPNEGAVAAEVSTNGAADAWNWTPLLDETRQVEDMSFMLFTEPAKADNDPVDSSTDPNDGSVEIIIPPIRKKG
jgi:hypothetical protein